MLQSCEDGSQAPPAEPGDSGADNVIFEYIWEPFTFETIMQPSLSTSAAEMWKCISSMVERHEYSISPLKRGLGALNDKQAIWKGRNGGNITTCVIILLGFNVLLWRGLLTTVVDGVHAFLLHICCIILAQRSKLQLQNANTSQPMALLSSTFVGVDVPHPEK